MSVSSPEMDDGVQAFVDLSEERVERIIPAVRLDSSESIYFPPMT